MTVAAARPAPARLGARALIDLVLDPGSFSSWDTEPARRPGLDPAYAAQLDAAARRSGSDEAVVTGCGTLEGRRVAVIVSDFTFLGGTVGIATADRLVHTIRRATAERLPLLAATASGGTRMQEGTEAFVRMIGVTQAVVAHRRAGLPYLVHLRHPTTGGVFASWGSLGQLTTAEPGALVGFLGPKVYAALNGQPFPAGVQTGENLHGHGIVDAVLPAERLRGAAVRALAVTGAAWRGLPVPPATAEEDQPAETAWSSITRTRRNDRPGVRDLLAAAASDVTLLSGTGAGETSSGVLLGLARFSGVPCVVVGQDRSDRTASGPDALRIARRGIRLADELDLPLVCVVDTPGAALSPAAEEGGLAGEIARCLADLAVLATPTVSVILGQGCGGLALAMLPADRVLAARHAWLSPLPPEGASAIVHGDASHAPAMAEEQRVAAPHLRRAGLVDRIIPEHDDAADEPEAFSRRVGEVIAQEVALLGQANPAERLARRARRYGA